MTVRSSNAVMHRRVGRGWAPLAPAVLLGMMLRAAAAESYELPWGIAVHTRVKVSRVRSLDSAASSFVFEAVLQYAWRDDSLFDFTKDGDSYVATEGGNGAHSNFSVVTKGALLIPSVTPLPLSVLDTSHNEIDWSVQYEWPTWTGLEPEASMCSWCTTASAIEPLAPVWVIGTQDVSITFSHSQSLRNFPFDTQDISVSFMNKAQMAMNMYFVVAPVTNSGPESSLRPAADPPGFFTRSWGARTAERTCRKCYPIAPDNAGVSMLVISYSMERDPNFFVHRFIVPLSLLFMMATLMLALEPKTRVFAPLTAFGSTVSFLFVAGQSVPPLPYSTRLDKFFTFCFYYATLLFVYSLILVLRFDRVGAAVTLSKARAHAAGIEGTPWLRPKGVPDEKKAPRCLRWCRDRGRPRHARRFERRPCRPEGGVFSRGCCADRRR